MASGGVSRKIHSQRESTRCTKSCTKKCHKTTLLALGADPSPYCSFVLFFQSRAMNRIGFKKLMYSGRPKGCITQGATSTLSDKPRKLVDQFTYIDSSISSAEKVLCISIGKELTVIVSLSIILKSDFSYKIKRIGWCPWCNGYRRRKWTQRHEFKSWMRLIVFHIALIPLGKV